jgi:prepilin-type processing-associated H-X9-DG protein
MRRRDGFTGKELLVVLTIVVLGFFLLGRLAERMILRAKGLAREASCVMNLHNIGEALGAYVTENAGQFPWLQSDNRWDAATGESQQRAPSSQTKYNVSALLFLLVRGNQSPGIFVCPSAGDVPDPNTRTGQEFNWDFSPYSRCQVEYVSYSYQSPLLDSRGVWRSGVAADSNGALPILADRTPTYAGLNAQFNWASRGRANPKTGMSQNHWDGETVNVLYADLHVDWGVGRADCGIRNDNIYSAAGSGADGHPLDTNQGPGTLDVSDHRSLNDSFLLGPKKMEK